MHYRNGREAKNGDKIVQFEMNTAQVIAVGRLRGAAPGNNYRNGEIVQYLGLGQTTIVWGYACLCDCLHIEDVAAILAEKGLDKRPAGM